MLVVQMLYLGAQLGRDVRVGENTVQLADSLLMIWEKTTGGKFVMGICRPGNQVRTGRSAGRHAGLAGSLSEIA